MKKILLFAGILALPAYMELTKWMKDPKFAEQASKLAGQIKDSRKTNDEVSVWMNQEPKKVAALNALRGNDKKAAVKELSTLLAAEPENFQNALLELSSILQKEGKEKFVYDTLEVLSAKTTSNKPVIYFVQSLLAMQMKNNAQAEKKIEQTLALQPDWEHPLLIQAQLAIMANDLNHAKTLLNSAILKHPNNATFKKLLAQTLIKTNEYEAAAQQYQALITQNPKDGENYIALALINLQLNRESNAETILKTLAEQADWTSPASFYLGKIEEKRGNTDAAISLFDKVNDANFSLEADMSTINLRAKKVLAKEPNNAEALHALGYTLLNDSSRYKDAEKYLQRAIKLQPEEPAIMDSFGWLQFKLGNYPQAIQYLQAAYEKLNSGEIAAHLCEVLWIMGQKNDSQKLFDEAIKITPEDADLLNFKKRFLEQ